MRLLVFVLLVFAGCFQRPKFVVQESVYECKPAAVAAMCRNEMRKLVDGS